MRSIQGRVWAIRGENVSVGSPRILESLGDTVIGRELAQELKDLNELVKRRAV